MKLYADGAVHRLHEAFERHIAQIDTQREWDVRGLSGHDIDRDGETQLVLDTRRAVNDFVTDKAALRTLLDRLMALYTDLKSGTTVTDAAGLSTGNSHLVAGYMRTGGTFLFKQLMAAVGLNYLDYSLLMTHDSLPSYSYCVPEYQSQTESALLMEMAEFAVWLQDCWPASTPLVQKRIAYGHDLGRIERLMGGSVQWWITLRDPTDCIRSFFKMEGMDPNGRQGYPGFWKAACLRFQEESMAEWEAKPNYQKALDNWAMFHMDLFKGLDQVEQAILCPYEHFSELGERAPLPVDMSEFNHRPTERPDFFNAADHNRAIERVLKAVRNEHTPTLETYLA